MIDWGLPLIGIRENVELMTESRKVNDLYAARRHELLAAEGLRAIGELLTQSIVCGQASAKVIQFPRMRGP